MLEAESPTDAVRLVLAQSYVYLGKVLFWTGGKPAESLVWLEKARAIYQNLADTNPTVIEFQRHLANIHLNIGVKLHTTGKAADAQIGAPAQATT